VEGGHDVQVPRLVQLIEVGRRFGHTLSTRDRRVVGCGTRRTISLEDVDQPAAMSRIAWWSPLCSRPFMPAGDRLGYRLLARRWHVRSCLFRAWQAHDRYQALDRPTA
jgi:hypothetical protein